MATDSDDDNKVMNDDDDMRTIRGWHVDDMRINEEMLWTDDEIAMTTMMTAMSMIIVVLRTSFKYSSSTMIGLTELIVL